VYFPPWPPSGATSSTIGTIINGNIVPVPQGQGPPPVLPVHEVPPTGILWFRFTPGTKAIQIQTSSWPSRKIVFYAPTTNLLSIFMGPSSVTPFGSATMEIPPGSSGTIEIADVILIYFVAQNATDILTGWVESNL